MVDVTPIGPSSLARWKERTLAGEQTESVTILTLPDAANDSLIAAGQSAVAYALAKIPLLVHRDNGDPVFSLTLLLSRQPKPDEDNVYPLIEGGILGFDVRLGVPTALLTRLQCGDDVEYKRLFIREATLDLVLLQADSERVLASMQASGTEARAALSVTLARAETLNVLSVLEGTPAPLELRAQLLYRVAASEQTIRLYGAWAAIYDVLMTYIDVNGELSLTQLRQAVQAMLASGVLAIYRGDAPTAEPAPNVASDDIFDMFMRLSSVILKHRSSENPQAESQYALRGRPHESFALNYTQTLSAANQRSISLQASLDEVIGHSLEGRDWEQFVHLVSSGQSGGAGLGPVPRRVKTLSNQPLRTSRRASTALQLAAINGSIRSVASATRPVVKPTIVASEPIFMPLPAPVLKPAPSQHVVLDDVVLELPQKQPVRSLPVVDNPSAGVWRDRKVLAQRWYAPVFEVVQPSPSNQPPASPFLFEYQRSGVAASGQTALQGTVRFTLRKTMSAQTQAALGKIWNPQRTQTPVTRIWNPPVSPVPTKNLSVLLLVPFVDDKDGRVKIHSFKATVRETGDTLTATVILMNEWVRLCYGALAKAGFQSIPVRLSTAYSFEAYVPVRQQDFELAFGGKALQTQVVYSATDANQLAGRPYLDAKALTYRLPVGEVRFQREARGDTKISPANAVRVMPTLIATRPTLGTVTKLPANQIAARPQLTVSANMSTLMQKVQYATRTQVRRDYLNVLYPCNTLGHFYREKVGKTSTAVGCRDALQLGQTHYRQYEEITDLRDPKYDVYRSLSQPGQFLVVPHQYCITRQSATGSEAYRPLIILYASIDPDDPINNWLTLDITLQPDLPPYTRRALLARLEAYTHAPVIQYPTEISVDQIEYDWNLGSRDIVVNHNLIGPFIQVSMEMDPVTWLLQLARLEETGIHGSMRLTLPDGTAIRASLVLQLNQIRGPWDSGPIEVEVTDHHVRLTNKIEQALDIHDLVTYQGSGVASSVPAEISLAPGATDSTITLPSAAHEVYANYAFPAGDPTTIREVRSFVEDIHRNFVFVNLINFGNHQLNRLEIQARIKAVVGVYTAQMTEGMPVAEIDVTLPLTTYLESHVLQFRVTKVFSSDAQPTTTPWLDLNFDTSGNVVSLTWPLIQ